MTIRSRRSFYLFRTREGAPVSSDVMCLSILTASLRTATVMASLLVSQVIGAQVLTTAEGTEPGVPDAHWARLYFPLFDAVSASGGLAPLRTAEPSEGAREVRVWIGGGIGYPQSLFRVVEKGADVAGELVLYWRTHGESEPPGETFHDLMVFYQTGSCDGFAAAEGVGTCRALFDRRPDWGSVLREAERAGLWSLPDSSELPDDGLVTIDGWAITVEMRDGAAYRAYHYDNPDAHPSWPEAHQAAEIASVFRDVRAQVRQAEVERIYRGVTTGEYGSAFSLCDSDIVWGTRFSLAGLAEKAGLAIPDSGPFGYVVAVKGKPTPEWLARRWNSSFSRELQGIAIESIAPAQALACE